jgi:hypothetical protein
LFSLICFESEELLELFNDKIIPFFKEDVSIIFKNEVHIAKSHKGDLRSENYFARLESMSDAPMPKSP